MPSWHLHFRLTAGGSACHHSGWLVILTSLLLVLSLQLQKHMHSCLHTILVHSKNNVKIQWQIKYYLKAISLKYLPTKIKSILNHFLLTLGGMQETSCDVNGMTSVVISSRTCDHIQNQHCKTTSCLFMQMQKTHHALLRPNLLAFSAFSFRTKSPCSFTRS